MSIPVRGPRTPYRPKVYPALSVRLTPAADEAMRAACSRIWGDHFGQRRGSLLVEHLLRTRHQRLRSIGPVEVKGGMAATFALTIIAKRKLMAVIERTGRGRSVLVSELLEQFAADVVETEFPVMQTRLARKGAAA